MENESSFKMSQDYELMAPKKKKAYPILIEEWQHLKEKIQRIKDDANLYHTIGSILLGVAGSSLLAALTLDFPSSESASIPMPIIISWFMFFTSFICGCLSIFFGRKQRKVQSTSCEEVIEHMELIEKRYESEKT